MTEQTVPVMSERELKELGDGHVAYITLLTSERAAELFPSVRNLPKGVDLFALYGADGTPLALTDTRSAAIGHALGDELEIAQVH